ncbi:MAG: hypothetical protein MJY67_07485 [Bacteroidales bacterium]|nr:hypothetical protein [Bacteroidales bacterium]
MCAGEFGSYMKALAELLFPRFCPVCSKKLEWWEDHLCLPCRLDVPLTYYWKTDHNPMADRLNERINQAIESGDIPAGEKYAFAAALYFYKDDSGYRNLVRRLKYEGDIALGRHVSVLMAKKIQEGGHFRDVDMVVSVPLHWTRRFSRGYNQAAVIGETIAAHLGVPFEGGVLKRGRRTKTQTKVAVQDKGSNVRGAFVTGRRAADVPAPKHVLLVDDTFTTGATTVECYKVLRFLWGGATRISVITLACVGK